MFFHYELTHNIHYAASCIIMILSVNKVAYVHYKRAIIVEKPIKRYYRTDLSVIRDAQAGDLPVADPVTPNALNAKVYN